MRHRRALTFTCFGALAIVCLSMAQDHGVQAVIGNVFLQDTSPGTEQIGHAAIKGTFRAGQVNVVQGTGTTIPVIGNNQATGAGTSVGGSFSAGQQNSIALRGTATSRIGPNIGVYGETRSTGGTGVFGLARSASAFGVWARNTDASGPALVAENTAAAGLAAKFFGKVSVMGGVTLLDSSGKTYWKANTVPGLFNTVELSYLGSSITPTFMSSGPNSSSFTLYSSSVPQVRLSADSNGVGRVTADVKNFVQPDPDDESRDIVYACVEGPEAAAYIRGTAKLVNGFARVALPRHFQNVSVAERMTVQVTPRSADSEGLAVVSQSLTGFDVRELRRGRGTYEFHWEVKAVRRGFADYKVYEAWSDRLSPGTDPAEAMAARRNNAREVYGIRYSASRP